MYRTFFVFLKCTIQGGPRIDVLLIAFLYLWLKFWEGIDKYWIVPDSPSRPKDFCNCFDPICEDDVKLALFTTFCCWLLLGIVPVIVGIVGIRYAYKAKASKDLEERERCASISRSISWAGLVLFASAAAITLIAIAIFGIF